MFRENSKLRRATLVATAELCLLAGGCAGGGASTEAATPDATETTHASERKVVRESAPARESTPPAATPAEQQSNPSVLTAADRGITLPPQAYQGAGTNQAPDSAIRLGDSAGNFIFTGPNHNIFCGTGVGTPWWPDEAMGCHVVSWKTDPIALSEEGVPRNGIEMNLDGTSQLTGFDGFAVNAQSIPYGNVIANGNWACATESNGVTCWALDTGHGFFVRKAEFLQF